MVRGVLCTGGRRRRRTRAYASTPTIGGGIVTGLPSGGMSVIVFAYNYDLSLEVYTPSLYLTFL